LFLLLFHQTTKQKQNNRTKQLKNDTTKYKKQKQKTSNTTKQNKTKIAIQPQNTSTLPKTHQTEPNNSIQNFRSLSFIHSFYKQKIHFVISLSLSLLSFFVFCFVLIFASSRGERRNNNPV